MAQHHLLLDLMYRFLLRQCELFEKECESANARLDMAQAAYNENPENLNWLWVRGTSRKYRNVLHLHHGARSDLKNLRRLIKGEKRQALKRRLDQ